MYHSMTHLFKIVRVAFCAREEECSAKRLHARVCVCRAMRYHLRACVHAHGMSDMSHVRMCACMQIMLICSYCAYLTAYAWQCWRAIHHMRKRCYMRMRQLNLALQLELRVRATAMSFVCVSDTARPTTRGSAGHRSQAVHASVCAAWGGGREPHSITSHHIAPHQTNQTKSRNVTWHSW